MADAAGPQQPLQQAMQGAAALLDAGRQHLDTLRNQVMGALPWHQHARGDGPSPPSQQRSKGSKAAFYTTLMQQPGAAVPPLQLQWNQANPASSTRHAAWQHGASPALLLASISSSSSPLSPSSAHSPGPLTTTSGAQYQHIPLTQLAASVSPPARAGPQPHATSAAAAAAARQQPVSVSTGEDGGEMLSALRKAELGRATWTLLHMLAAQYPERPTRQQRRDARQLIECLTRIYPCGSCASHFAQIVRRKPPSVNSRSELQQWTCQVHNVVNRSLGKPEFNCNVVGARWAPLECGPDGEEDGATGCDMTVGARGAARRTGGSRSQRN